MWCFFLHKAAMDVLGCPSEMGPRLDRMSSAWEVVLPLAPLARDLGMDTSRALQKQLDVDLPRSYVLVDGRRAIAPSEVMRATHLGRFCTQAVLAPPVEWLLLRMGLIAHEPPSSLPMIAVVAEAGRRVHVSKRLALREWMSEAARGEVLVEFDADERAGQCAYRFTLVPAE